MEKKLSVVIPNYNGIDYLENCVDSLMRQHFQGFEVIIVDDASSDKSLPLLQQKYPEGLLSLPDTTEYADNVEIRYLQHKENKGFAASVNTGIKMARAPYVFLLNNDTVAEPECLDALYRAIGKSDKLFSVSAKMVSLQNPEIMDDGGDYYCALGWAFSPAKGKNASVYNKKKRIFSSCAGAALYRKDLLEQIGLFDENHFAYLEDVDVGYRAKLCGYENIFVPRAVVRHAGSATSGSRYNPFKAKLTARNNIYLIYKNMPIWQLIFNGPLLVIGTLVKWMFYCRKNMGGIYWQGMKEGFILCKQEKGRMHRVNFRKISVLRQFSIEAELLINIIRRFL